MKNIFKNSFFWIIFFGFFILISGIFNTFIYAQSKSALGESDEKDSKGIIKKLNYVPGEVIVKYKNENLDLKKSSGFLKSLSFEQKFSLEKKDEIRNLNIQVFKTKKNVEETIKELRDDPNVEYVEPNYIRNLTSINATDTYKDLLWGLDNTGQNVNGTMGTVDKDIDAPAAWGLSEGSGVIVAVIDSGVAYNHPDLVANMWDGSSCLDEDGNVLGGCNYGYDFEKNDKTPLPEISSHGTHVAGTIAAEKNNSKGIIGVAPQTKIMALKIGFGSGWDSLKEIKAIDFAIQNGAKVINASYGGGNFSQTEYDAINRFKTAGGIFVAAAGNESTNNDNGTHNYPSDYDLDNIISVAAIDQNDNLASFSNYGTVSIDIGAPGTNIYSTVPSEIVLYDEDFEDSNPPYIPPTGWSSSTNNFGTYDLGGAWGKVLYGDLSYPYESNVYNDITSITYNLTNGGSFSFWTACDTEYSSSNWTDYMTLQYSGDNGSTFHEVLRWDEYYLDTDSNSSGGASYHFENLNIPNQYLTSNFKFRFTFTTNGVDNSHDGCRIDDIYLNTFSDGSDEKYYYMDGTSMAAPHVAGAVAVFMSKYPAMSTVDIKNVLVNTGADTLNSLSGKTVYGKRLNLYRALLSNETYPEGSVFRFWSNQNKHHFYTVSKNERDFVAAIYDENAWKYESVAYTAFTDPAENRVPLYRFWSNRNRAHFYTASESEKNNVINTYASDPDGWSYESIGFYVYDTGYTGPSKPVYRFWSNQNRGHFYTASEAEKNIVIDIYNDDQWLYEGVAFKVALD